MITNRKRVLGFIFISIGVVVCCFGVWALLKPPQYQAAARIRMISVDDRTVPGDEGIAYSNFIQAEYRVLQSDMILGKAVETLASDAMWDKKHAMEKPLRKSDSIKQLRQHMSLRPVPNARLVDIRIATDDADESALIANAIARAYADHWREMKKRFRETQRPKMDDEETSRLIISDPFVIITDLAMAPSSPIRRKYFYLILAFLVTIVGLFLLRRSEEAPLTMS